MPRSPPPSPLFPYTTLFRSDEARPYQLDTRMLTREELATVVPGLTGDWLGGLYTASDGRGEPQKAAPAIATAAQKHGRSEGQTSELQSPVQLVSRLLLEKKK